jgi:hypothetical protein
LKPLWLSHANVHWPIRRLSQATDWRISDSQLDVDGDMIKTRTGWTQLVGCMIAMTAFPLLAGEIHKWVDESGNIHYSDQPPPTEAKKSSTLRAASRATTAAPAEGGKEETAAKKALTPAEQEMEFKKRRSEQAEKEVKTEKENQEAKERARNCELARGHLARVQQGGLMTTTSPSGEVSYMNEQSIAAELERARKQVEQACKT